MENACTVIVWNVLKKTQIFHKFVLFVLNLSFPLSSLPINYSLLYWRSLSPPFPQNEENDQTNSKINMSIQINISKLSTLSNKRIKFEEEKECGESPFTQKRCEECEENKAELHCKECKFFFCTSCSNQVHSLKVMKNHSISLSCSLNDIGNSSTNIQSNSFTNFLKCDLHNQKEKNYCEKCKECVCVYCIVDNHQLHYAISVIDKVTDVKTNNQNLNAREKIILKSAKDIDSEINQLEDKLKILKEKKAALDTILDDISHSKEKVNLTTSFLSSFIHSLPPLPLSSFISSEKNIINGNNDNNLNIEEINENISRSRIKDFFDINKLKDLFSSIISTSLQSKNNNIILYRTDPLINDKNLILHCTSNEDYKFKSPLFTTYNDKLNIIGISDNLSNSFFQSKRNSS